MHKLKSMFFSQLTLLSYNLVLTSYLSGANLKSWVFWLWSAENIEEKKKQIGEKHWKVKRKNTEKYEESQKATIYIFGLNYILLENIILKKVVHAIKFY